VGSDRPEPVQLPHHQGVAKAELVKELLEGRAVAAGAAGGLGEHPVASRRARGVDLAVLLVSSGDAGEFEQVPHRSQNPVIRLVLRR
jgi:hypothetical protein